MIALSTFPPLNPATAPSIPPITMDKITIVRDAINVILPPNKILQNVERPTWSFPNKDDTPSETPGDA